VHSHVKNHPESSEDTQQLVFPIQN
jgi:hypothetical protein